MPRRMEAIAATARCALPMIGVIATAKICLSYMWRTLTRRARGKESALPPLWRPAMTSRQERACCTYLPACPGWARQRTQQQGCTGMSTRWTCCKGVGNTTCATLMCASGYSPRSGPSGTQPSGSACRAPHSRCGGWSALWLPYEAGSSPKGWTVCLTRSKPTWSCTTRWQSSRQNLPRRRSWRGARW